MENCVICVDLNGVLDRYTGWRHEKHWDPPRPGAEEFLRRLHERGFRVVVFTTRWADDAWRWLAEHGLDRWVSEVTDRKPAAHVFVDDRAVCFRGDYEETLEAVIAFRAHWEEGKGLKDDDLGSQDGRDPEQDGDLGSQDGRNPE